MTAKTAGKEATIFADWLQTQGIETTDREGLYLKGKRWRYDLRIPIVINELIKGFLFVEIDGGSYQFGGGKHATPEDYAKIAFLESYLKPINGRILRIHLAMTKEKSIYRPWVLAIIKAILAGNEEPPLPPKKPRKPIKGASVKCPKKVTARSSTETSRQP